MESITGTGSIEGRRQEIITPHPEAFDKKLAQLISGGPESLHIVSDFDRTLTRAYVEGSAKANTTTGLIASPEFTSQAFADGVHDMFQHYYPIEIDLSIANETRDKKMEEWWQKYFELMVHERITRSMIEKAVQSDTLLLREGFRRFVEIAGERGVPILIFSAGVGDLITGFLRKESLLAPNIHVIANFLDYNDRGEVIGVQGEMIHIANKDERAIRSAPYAQQIINRPNALLLGDSVHDVQMTKGMEHAVEMRLGFLNGQKESLEEFSRHFDAIVPEDGSLAFPITMLEKITARPASETAA